MSIKRSTRCRLCVETLEARAVPASLRTIDTSVPDPTTTGTAVAVVTDAPPTDPGSVVPVVTTGAPTDPGSAVPVLTDAPPTDPGSDVGVTTSLDGTPESQQIDLAVFATVDKIKPSLGDVVTIRFTIQNNGDVPASGAILTATMPAGLAPLSSQTNDGTYDATANTWTPGIIYPGAPVTMTIKARVTDSADQVVSAGITAADQTDPDTTNNTASLTVTPVLAGVSVSQIASQSVATINGTVTFTVTVKNTGPGIARNLAVQEAIPAGLTWVRVMTPEHGSFDVSSKTWKMAWLMPGTTATLQFVAQVHTTGRLQSTSVLTATGIDETRSNLQASATVVGTQTTSPATWTYTGPGYQPLPVMVAAPKPAPPPTWSASILAQIAAYLKLLKPGV